MIYERPSYYMISHVLFGFLAVWYPLIGIVAVLYQLAQYMMNVRVFPIEGRILYGNTAHHTALKLAEMGIGYGIGYSMRHRYFQSLAGRS